MYSEAIVDIKDILTEEFSEDNFTHLAINLVNLESEDLLNSTYSNEYNTVYENYVEYVKDIGKYRDLDRKTIVLSIVKLKHSPEKSRTMQRNFIAKHMKDICADASIVGLYCEDTDVWRISFVKLDYSIGIEGIYEELTPAKRYSYLIEPGLHNHTAVKQLSILYYDDAKKVNVQDIENIFSVEVVTDEFFKMYKEKYLDLKELLEKDVNFISEAQRLDIEIHDFSEEFAKKLMGQISFLYFLQKKGWLGVKIVPQKISKIELREIYRRQDEETRNIINKVYKPNNEFMVLSSRELKELSNEDAEKLACTFKNTIYDEEWGTGTKRFIRTIFDTAIKNNFNFFYEYLEPLFYNALNQKRGSTEYYQLFNCKIPFLNGGLFEPIYKYDWRKTHIEIPNEFFSYKVSNNDSGKGLLDVFDMYNFTINEDEPLEKEVAVDPEMLGKIFENLLEVKERRSKGAFYTPREIVHYMCQESLINYLSNKIQIPCEDIEMFIKYGEIIKDVDINIDKKENYKMPKTIINNLEKIDNALENVTVADPAVGSGAFPLGMLNEIVKARSIITNYDNQFSDTIDIFKDRSLYNLKKNTMKKSIFAVDIEPSAVDITKLRLWLSLVVDADVKTVNTLPNLDYNIMVGNSLIDEFRGIKLFDEELLKKIPKRRIKENRQISMNIDNNNKVNIGIEQEYQLLDDIQILQSKLFDTKNPNMKKVIKVKIEDKEWELIEYKLNRDKGLSFKEIEELKKQRKLHKRPYFLWKLEFSKVFKRNNGFDIVIGNPPYGAFIDYKNKEVLSKRYPNVPDYETADYFLCQSYDLLSEGGICAFIIPNTILTNVFAEKLRKELIKEWNIYAIDNLSDVDVFESASVRNCIPYIVKSKKKNSNIKLINTKIVNNSFDRTIESKDISILSDNINSWLNIFYQSEDSKRIIESIQKNSIKLGEICEVSQGLIAYDKYRGHSEEIIKNRIWHKDFKADATYRKELKGGDVKRYKLKWNGKRWISYGDWLAAPRKKEFFTEKRILIREITNPRIMACYTEEEYYNTPSIINIINFKYVSPYYILAIINSSLMTYYHNKISPKANKGLFPKILVKDVRNLPIRLCKDKKLMNRLIFLCKIMMNETNQISLSNIDNKIDEIIYDIYEIENDERKAINKFINKK